jgi:GH24 family phage-related lysozyme (muramidase)
MITAAELSNSDIAIYDRLKESIFAELHVAKIGIVTGYSPETGLPTVKPVNKQRIIDAKGNISWLDHPEIPDVLYAGDKPGVGSAVLLIICDDDTSPFINSTGTDSSGGAITQVPQLMSKHNLSNAVAIPLSSAASTSPGVTSSSGSAPSPTYARINASTTDIGIGISQAGLEFIEAWEGFRSDWYQDIAGHWTVGYGHMDDSKTLPAGFTVPLTGGPGGTGEDLLKYDLPPYISAVATQFSAITLTQNQADALIAFSYNLGAGIFPGTKLKAAIINGASNDELKERFEAFSNANIDGKLTVIKGLLYRRDAEWAAYANGVYLKP